MQRSRVDQNVVVLAGWLAAFTVYEALAMRYLFLPPMQGILLFFFIRALDRREAMLFVTVVIMSLILESAKGYWAFSLIIFYTLSYQFILPQVRALISCVPCRSVLMVAFAYPGFWLFLQLMSWMFALPTPVLSLNQFFYMMMEALFAGLL